MVKHENCDSSYKKIAINRKSKNFFSYQIMQVYIICANRFNRNQILLIRIIKSRDRRTKENRGWSWFEHVWICYWLMWFWGKRNFIVIYIRHSLENSFKFRLVQRNVWKEVVEIFREPSKTLVPSYLPVETREIFDLFKVRRKV